MAHAATAFIAPTPTAERAMAKDRRGLSGVLGPSSALMAALAATPAHGQSAEAEAAQIFFTGPQSAVTQVDATVAPSIEPNQIGGFDATSPGIRSLGCITHTLPDQPKGAYVLFDLRWGPQVEVMPTQLNEIGIMPDLPGAACSSLEAFKAAAEERAHDFGQKFAAAIDEINPGNGDARLSEAAAYLRNRESVKAPMQFARTAEQLFQTLRGAHPSIASGELPTLGIAQHKEAFMIRVVQDSLEKIEADLRNPHTVLRGIPINATPPVHDHPHGWAARPAVLTPGAGAPSLIRAQQVTNTAPTPGETGTVCIEYTSTESATRGFVVANTSGFGIGRLPFGTDPSEPATWQGVNCGHFEAFEAGVRERSAEFARDVGRFARDLAAATGRPELAAGMELLLADDAGLDPMATNRNAAIIFRQATEGVQGVEPAVLQSVISADDLHALWVRGGQTHTEATLYEKVQAGLAQLEANYGTRLERLLGDPIRFESGPESPQALQIREASARDVRPSPAPRPDFARRLTA